MRWTRPTRHNTVWDILWKLSAGQSQIVSAGEQYMALIPRVGIANRQTKNLHNIQSAKGV
jgi:hypothetical protein